MAPYMDERKYARLTSGIRKEPSYKKNLWDSTQAEWLKAKRKDDDVWPYWRIHDGLYDLKDFIARHPGGKMWIEDTQGLDITESFESSHLFEDAYKILPKYFVKKTNKPRQSPYTFKEDGFYQTLKRKVAPIVRKQGKQELWKFKLVTDVLFFSFLVCFFIGGLTYTFFPLVMAALLLVLSANAAHNYFHQRDNIRMYIFDFTVLGSRQNRITHGISHHIFPNTAYDLEMLIGEPFFTPVPHKHKNFIQRFGILVYLPVLGIFFGPSNIVFRLHHIVSGKDKFVWPDLIVFLQMVVLMLCRMSLLEGFVCWLFLHTVEGQITTFHYLITDHYTGVTCLEMDKSLENKDWGLHQLASTHDKSEMLDSFFLMAVFYGNHALHHLFPTVDHSVLPLLTRVFLETCEEFGLKYQKDSIVVTATGAIKETSRVIPHETLAKSVRHYKKPTKGGSDEGVTASGSLKSFVNCSSLQARGRS